VHPPGDKSSGEKRRQVAAVRNCEPLRHDATFRFYGTADIHIPRQPPDIQRVSGLSTPYQSGTSKVLDSSEVFRSMPL